MRFQWPTLDKTSESLSPMDSSFEPQLEFLLDLELELDLLRREREDTTVSERGREHERLDFPPRSYGCDDFESSDDSSRSTERLRRSTLDSTESFT